MLGWSELGVLEHRENDLNLCHSRHLCGVPLGMGMWLHQLTAWSNDALSNRVRKRRLESLQHHSRGGGAALVCEHSTQEH